MVLECGKNCFFSEYKTSLCVAHAECQVRYVFWAGLDGAPAVQRPWWWGSMGLSGARARGREGEPGSVAIGAMALSLVHGSSGTMTVGFAVTSAAPPAAASRAVSLISIHKAGGREPPSKTPGSGAARPSPGAIMGVAPAGLSVGVIRGSRLDPSGPPQERACSGAPQGRPRGARRATRQMSPWRREGQ